MTNEDIKYIKNSSFYKDELFLIGDMFDKQSIKLEEEKKISKASKLNTNRLTRQINQAKAISKKAFDKWYYYNAFTY